MCQHCNLTSNFLFYILLFLYFIQKARCYDWYLSYLLQLLLGICVASLGCAKITQSLKSRALQALSRFLV